MIEVKNISKSYGRVKAVEDVSFELKEGEIIGFLGANGAGKSTTMKILSGILTPDSGEVSIFGTDFQHKPMETKRRIGFLEEDNPLYTYMYVKEYLAYVARIYMPSSAVADSVDEIIEKTGLKDEYKKKIGSLSKGNRQRVGLAQALVHNPDFLILDEPTSGLDPNQQAEIRNVIKNLGSEKIVLFSSHSIQEVQSICSRVMIIDKGKLLLDKNRDEIVDLESVFYEMTK